MMKYAYFFFFMLLFISQLDTAISESHLHTFFQIVDKL